MTASDHLPRIEGFDPAAFADLTLTGGFFEAVPMVLDYVSPVRVEAHLEAGERHLQPYGIVHGGVYATLIESLASLGAAINVLDSGMAVVGVSNQTDFLRPHRGGRLDAVAEPLQAGRLQQLWQVVITAAETGKVVARGQVRLQVIDRARVVA